MKKLIFSCFLCISSYLCLAQDREAVIKVLDDQRTAWNKGDIEGFMQGYWKSDSLMFIGKSAPVYGWQSTLDRYKKSYPGKAGMGELTFDIIQVKILDDHNAFVLGGWHLKLENSALSGYFTLWFRKINGEWKIVCDHTS
ncbi:MAG TPA: nuclear transport factor 2 family protein [Mucilaginibacter sp.]|jgi:ketosteroid isomerase-like protein|nr:nuclear transport factor 2 family protein [Mucilaginibacter sp.]